MVRDLPTPPPQRLSLDGPAGRLGATFERPAGRPRAAVLHLHPHPVHGGTRRNNVVRYGALGSLEAECAALRIDFRGAGDSEGEHDHGRGEVEDATHAFEWLRLQVPEVPAFVWGFSFGSRVGLDLSIASDAVQGYMGIGWPTSMYAWPEAEPWPDRMAFLAGEQDEFVDPQRLEPVRHRGARIEYVPGANHFFHGQLEQVRRFTAETLRGWLA